ncbi:hypothetical protein [Pseudogulbenkiania subflava]|uniref:Membrane-bound lysozyme-inhibitor of c-type lysozyme n=1 Tax=Pseudogulbenkiania subflava DSM 22618 TaxID=1123014 RepID=A0A1Y6B7G7_9NEIS|nr:hypothetical protein [Pseudogulbenkiania subflava]SME92555.1 hypothetical protein SAMN02745746_00088 [Pseudogulbenkiania subflava DSM 22618]
MNPPRLTPLCAVVLALTLAACATPQTAGGKRVASQAQAPAPAAKTAAVPPVPSSPPASRLAAAADCIQGGAQKWGIPADYLTRQTRADGGIVLTLVNPYSGKRGLSIELTPDGRHTEANLDENGTVVSAKWRGLVSRCTDGA